MARVFDVALATVVLVCAIGAVSADKRMEVGDIWTRVLGQSGKIMLGKQGSNDATAVVRFVSLEEKDKDGNSIGVAGKAGGAKHSFNSFATQDFTFSNPTVGSLQGINMTTFTFQANMVGGAVLKAQAYLFSENGTIQNGNETTSVVAGDFKFNVALDNWPWCTAGGSGDSSCGTGNNVEVGTDIDFTMSVTYFNPKSGSGSGSTSGSGSASGSASGSGSGQRRLGAPRQLAPRRTMPCKNDPNKTCQKPEKLALGDAGALDLSSKVKKGNDWVDMPAGFPAVTASNNGMTVKVRFPKSDKLVYDPVISLSTDSDSGSDSGSDTDSAAAARLPSSLLTAFVLCVVTLAASMSLW